jgi:elongation factor P
MNLDRSDESGNDLTNFVLRLGNNSLILPKIICMSKVSEISRGNFVRYNGELSIVLEYEHRTPGNLRAFYQVKMRNLKSGRLIEQRFRPDDDMEIVRVVFKEHQFLYLDGGNVVCMDIETYDQVHVPKETIGEGINLLKEGTNLKVYFDGDEPVFAELPVSVEMEVTYTEPGMKGDTATRTLKAATIETGAQIKVPLFIAIGDRIKIDTRTGDYLERCK